MHTAHFTRPTRCLKKRGLIHTTPKMRTPFYTASGPQGVHNKRDCTVVENHSKPTVTYIAAL